MLSRLTATFKMAEEGIKIDASVFHDRLSHFQAQWKNDKRSGDAIFKGVGSIIILLGKAEDDVNYRKNNAFEVGHPFSHHRRR